MDEGDLTKYVKDSVILLDVVHTVQLVVDSSAGYHLIIIGSMMMMTMMMVMMMMMMMMMRWRIMILMTKRVRMRRRISKGNIHFICHFVLFTVPTKQHSPRWSKTFLR